MANACWTCKRKKACNKLISTAAGAAYKSSKRTKLGIIRKLLKMNVCDSQKLSEIENVCMGRG